VTKLGRFQGTPKRNNITAGAPVSLDKPGWWYTRATKPGRLFDLEVIIYGGASLCEMTRIQISLHLDIPCVAILTAVYLQNELEEF
jgi:hypothetical protein